MTHKTQTNDTNRRIHGGRVSRTFHISVVHSKCSFIGILHFLFTKVVHCVETSWRICARWCRVQQVLCCCEFLGLGKLAELFSSCVRDVFQTFGMRLVRAELFFFMRELSR